ncbi:hypothetical protein [[Clostridium] colinum]|uniref:hypothetical protein n=1 Tax=[Clostridium] colinum TaxID=36835 RepID=UPI0020251CF1|nr:hypothetical protein [[Clostridium] colinum]
MKKENIKLVEEKIKEYFQNEEKILFIKNLIVSLEDKKILLKEKNRNLELDFDIDIKSIAMDNMPKGNSDGTSYFENNILKQIQYNEKMIEKIEEDIKNQEDEILVLEIKNAKMKNIIDILNDDFKQMLELRYKAQESEIYIFNKLNLSKSQYHLLRKKILSSIYNILIMYKEI